MIEIDDINDHETLEAWINQQPEDKRREIAVTIASRAALRVLPLFWQSDRLWSGKPELTALPVLWPSLISAVAALVPTAEIDAAVDAAAAADAAAANAAYAAAYAAYAADAAAYAAYAAYAAADAADAAYAAVWSMVKEDCSSIVNGHASTHEPIWRGQDNPFASAWTRVQAQVPPAAAHSEKSHRGPHPLGDWTFWIDWYQSVLDGKPMNPDMLLEIVHIRKEGEDYAFLWTKDPAEANRRVMEIYRRYYPLGGTPISKANVADFEPNTQLDWMEMIGLPADLDHIRDAEAVQAFMDDIGDLKDRFGDFADYTAELRGRRNIGGVLSRNADKIMDVLRHAEDKDHLKARRLVELGGDLFYWSLEEKTRAELGVGLCRQLDSALNRLKDVCRRHLGPSMQAMEALNTLELGDRSPDDWVGAIEAALHRIDGADPDVLVPLAPDARATLEDMLGDLRLLAAARAEARTDAWKAETDGRFTRSAGATTATIGKYIERGSSAAKKTGEGMDETIKWYKRWTSMEDMWRWITELLSNTPPPGA